MLYICITATGFFFSRSQFLRKIETRSTLTFPSYKEKMRRCFSSVLLYSRATFARPFTFMRVGCRLSVRASIGWKRQRIKRGAAVGTPFASPKLERARVSQSNFLGHNDDGQARRATEEMETNCRLLDKQTRKSRRESALARSQLHSHHFRGPNCRFCFFCERA
jgi:hypothetical protein